MKKESIDNDLVRRTVEGDIEAFSELVSIYHDRLRGYIVRLCANDADADDICQESYRKAYLSLAHFNPECSFRRWLFSIAHNTALDHFRKRSNFTTVKLGEDDESLANNGGEMEASPEQNMIDNQAYSAFMEAVSRLSPLYRRVAELRLLHGYAYEEIARQTGLPLNTVRTRLRRAKEQINKMIGPKDEQR